MKLPEKGFYYHYKHDPELDINNYSYDVMGVAINSEDETLTVIYRPIYKSDFSAHVDFCARPLEMFMEHVNIKGKTIARFRKIIDPDIIYKLEEIKESMYGSGK